VTVLAAVLLLSAGVLLAGASALTAWLLRPDSAVDAAVSFGVLAAAGAATVVLVAGAPGLLTPAVVLALQTGWAVVAGVAAWRRGLRLPRLPRLRLRIAKERPWAAAVVGLAVVALAWQLLVALVLPAYAFDALTYHLTTVATWLGEENIEPTPLSLCCAYYPANSELIFTWPALFGDADTFVDTVQIGFAALAALAVAGIARSAGLPAWAAAAAAGLFAVTPAVLTQAPTSYADVMVAACALAALHSLVRFAVTGAGQRIVVAGLAAGLVLGTKGTGIVWAGVLTATAIVLIGGLWRADRISARAAGRAIAGFAVALAAIGGYWYARNAIETGNPVYPFRAELAGVRVFDGPLRVDDVLTQPEAAAARPRPIQVIASWAADLDFWRQGSYDYQQRAGGLGPLWPWLGLPLLMALAVVLARRRSPAFIALAAAGLVLVVQPYAWWARFTIPLMALAAVAIAAGAAWAPRVWIRRTVMIAALVLAAAGVVLSSFEVDPAGRGRELSSFDVLGLIGEPPERRTVSLFHSEYRFLGRVPEDAQVAVDLGAKAVRFVSPLFGRERRRDVVPAGSGEPLAGAWVVTGAGRPLDQRLRRDRRFRLAFSERGVRAWAPVR